MIIVTRPETGDRYNDKPISINELKINTVEPLPDDSKLEGNSKITMENWDTIIVKESMEVVNRKIEEKV